MHGPAADEPDDDKGSSKDHEAMSAIVERMDILGDTSRIGMLAR